MTDQIIHITAVLLRPPGDEHEPRQRLAYAVPAVYGAPGVEHRSFSTSGRNNIFVSCFHGASWQNTPACPRFEPLGRYLPPSRWARLLGCPIRSGTVVVPHVI